MDRTKLKQIKGIKDEQKAKTKGKAVGKLTAKEKDELLMTLAKIHGLI